MPNQKFYCNYETDIQKMKQFDKMSVTIKATRVRGT